MFIDTPALVNTARANGGATFKGFEPVAYKRGYQVATEGVILDATDTLAICRAMFDFNGNCGLWFDGGKCYVDRSTHQTAKNKALEIGRQHNQISIYDWKNGNCINC